MVAFALSILLTGVAGIRRPRAARRRATWSAWSTLLRIVPGAGAVRLALSAVLHADAQALPQAWAAANGRAPAFVTVWWLATTALLPAALSSLGGYDLTYGSLAGVMIALIFFFVIGLGVVIGAELNAALAETPRSGAVKEGDSAD